MMDESGKSDDRVVPKKPSNKAARVVAETGEGRGSTKGNSREQSAHQTQGWERASQALERVRRAARKDKKQRFTALLHHIYDIDRLREAFYALRKDAAPGVDGVTWDEYERDHEARLRDLSGRIKRGAFRAKPVLRAYVPKADGRQRPLGIPTLEDKIVQRATAEVLGAIYEVDFQGFSYGFRNERSPHLALDALTTGIMTKSVNWVLDADIRGFFDALDHEWLRKFLEHRIGDHRVIHLILKWLHAGVIEDGKRTRGERGTVQGGSISPLLGNLYLHHVLDLWIENWRRTRTKGDIVVVRFADDFVVGFEHRADAEQVHEELERRMASFGLELHPEKTRLIRFGRRARKDGTSDGPTGPPDTFTFLGFTHMCGRTRRGAFTVFRRTYRKTFQAKLREVAEWLRRHRHVAIAVQGRRLRAVVMGHVRYFGVPMNSGAITRFRQAIGRLWKKHLERRSQRGRITWERMRRLIASWLPPARICHPYPLERLGVTTRGRSPVR